MGLDMFMDRMKKIDGMTVKEIKEVENYIEYLNRSKEYKKLSYCDWYYGDKSKVRMDNGGCNRRRHDRAVRFIR